MPRRRKRTTDRVPQEDRQLRIRGVRRGSPDAKKLSRAFIGLALARAEAEAQTAAEERPMRNPDGQAQQDGDGRH